MQNEQNWPPKCCLTAVPLKVVLLALDAKGRNEYKNKAAEYAIAPGERLYCPGTACHKFTPPCRKLSPGSTRLSQKCPHCSLKICPMCRGEAHAELQDCPQDYGLNATLESANDAGWQRCYRCRAMIELTVGCRHITCKCSAEFCYVCGLKWRTCACTETDLVLRRAELTRRRRQRAQRDGARDAATLREEHEVARAIAEVAESERRQVAVREAEQRQREQEQREQEELLTRLKAMSAEEERQRQGAAALAEKQRVAIVRASMFEYIHILHIYLQNLVTFQQQTLNSRHESESSAIKEIADKDLAGHSKGIEAMMAMLTSNADKRRKTMLSRHVKESASLQAEHERRENAMFLQMQTYLQDKPNREERENRKGDFLRQLEEERDQQTVKHSVERMRFETQLQEEKRGIEKAHESSMQITQVRRDEKLRDLFYKMHTERQCFNFIIERRKRLMQLHSARLFADVEESREPQGLTREMAILNLLPFPRTDDVKDEQTIYVADLIDPLPPREAVTSEASDSVNLQVPVPIVAAQVLPTLATSTPFRMPSDESRDQENPATANSNTPTVFLNPTRTIERRKSSIWNVFGRSKNKSKGKNSDGQVGRW